MALQPYRPDDVYNQQALASAAMMRQGVIGNLAELKNQLPRVDSVIEIGVSTQENAAITHRVATLRLNYSPELEGKLRLDISVHKYEELDSQIRSLQASPNVRFSSTNQIVPLDGERALATPQWIEVITESGIADFDWMRGKERAPEALKVLHLMRETFPKGFPLPAHASVLQFHFRIIVRVPQNLEKEEKFARLVSNYGGKVGRCYGCSDRSASGEGVGEFTFAELSQEFDRMTAVAAGKALPSSIPEGAVVSGITGRSILQDREPKKKITNS